MPCLFRFCSHIFQKKWNSRLYELIIGTILIWTIALSPASHFLSASGQDVDDLHRLHSPAIDTAFLVHFEGLLQK